MHRTTNHFSSLMAIDRPGCGHSLYSLQALISTSLGNCARHFFYWREGSNSKCTSLSNTLKKPSTYAAGAAWFVFDKLNQINQNRGFHAEMVGQAAAEVVGEDQAPAGMAARDRFAVPAAAFRRSASRFSTARPPYEILLQREGRRNQGSDHRARRQNPDGQGMPDSRPL